MINACRYHPLRARFSPSPSPPPTHPKTASSWPSLATAFVVQSPSLGPAAAHHPYEHHHRQRPRPACAGRAARCNPSSGALCFSPRRQEPTRQQQQQQNPRASPATLAMVHSAADRACGTGLHREARGRASGAGRGRRRAPTSLSMTGSGKETGAEAGAVPKAGSAAKAKAEEGLRLFNTEGRTKQLFRPQDRK